jgi:hypothetical protein
MWILGNSRERKAVVTALSEVGERGLSVCGLGIAVDIPEAELTSVLDTLVSDGVVRRRGQGQPQDLGQGQTWIHTPGRSAPTYHMAQRGNPIVPSPRGRRTTA